VGLNISKKKGNAKIKKQALKKTCRKIDKCFSFCWGRFSLWSIHSKKKW